MTTGTPGKRALRSRTSCAVMLSASEQPARAEGMSTVFSGFRILAVSAMKRTPQKTMMSLFVLAAALHSSSESPVKSGIEW